MTAPIHGGEGDRPAPAPTVDGDRGPGRTLPPVPEASRRSRRRSWLLSLAAVVAIGVLAAALVRVPYYSLGPGAIRSTEPLVDLGGGERDPAAGDVAFATVTVSGDRVNLLQAFSGWIDDAVDVVPEDRILQGRSPQENQQVNQQLMDDSKQVAVQVALRRLGLAEPVGAEVVAVVDGSPAAAALQVGDDIVAIDGEPVTLSSDLSRMVGGRPPGTTLQVEVRPAAQGTPGTNPSATTETRTVVLAENPQNPTEGFLGVSIRTAFDETYGHEVTIDSGQVGGPSAGLAFTLGTIDLLTPGDLTGGVKVAATGTIGLDGTVGPIGGVQQKAAAARRAGVDLFLVPAAQTEGELARARDLAGDDVELVAVTNLDEALDALAARGGDQVAMAR